MVRYSTKRRADDDRIAELLELLQSLPPELPVILNIPTGTTNANSRPVQSVEVVKAQEMRSDGRPIGSSWTCCGWGEAENEWIGPPQPVVSLRT
jgi:hypothetical protein